MALPDFLDHRRAEVRDVRAAQRAGEAPDRPARGEGAEVLPHRRAPVLSSGGGPGDVATWAEHVWRRAGDDQALFDPAPPAPAAVRAPGSTSTTPTRTGASTTWSRTCASSRSCETRWSGRTRTGRICAARASSPRRISPLPHAGSRTSAGPRGGRTPGLRGAGALRRQAPAPPAPRFDREQVLLLRYDDLRDDPVTTADRVCAFLGVETGHVGEVPRHHVRPDVTGRTSGPTPGGAGRRAAGFAENAARLVRFASRALSGS